MERGGTPGNGRLATELLLIGGCVLALALLVVSLPTIAAAIGTDDVTVTDQAFSTGIPFAERTELIGGGAGGAAAESSIGVETGSDATTPFRSQSADREFTVRTAAPAYWRTDAYDQYDGRWIRTGSHTEYTGTIPAVGPVTVPVSQNVTVDQDAAVLPAAYQPAQVAGTGTDGVSVSSQTGMHPSTPVAANTTYTIDSYRYQPSLDLLRTSGANYPVSIEQRYTQLPDDLPDRVEELGTELTADADTPFEAVNTIDGSLAGDKAYTLDATHEPGADPVDQFLFEMDGGDAQYFASSMVVLLRSQGIPARYVAGYSVGEPVPDEDDAYTVRSVNAHAWVEVYFSGHGWVAFDPTPVEERLAVEDAAVDREGVMAHVPLVNENASTIERDLDLILDDPLPTDDDALADVDFDGDDGADDADSDTDDDTGGDDGTGDDAGTGGDDGTGDGDDTDGVTVIDETAPEGESLLTVTLSSETPQPGETVTVTVTRNGDPVRGVTVLFGETVVGQTDATGVVRGTVPYVRTLEVTVTTDPVSDTATEIEPVTVDTTATLGGAPTIGSHTDRSGVRARHAGIDPVAVASGLDGFNSHEGLAQANDIRAQTEDSDENTTVTSVPIEAVTTVDITPDPLVVGGEATVRMLINGQPVPAAEVRIDGETVGETSDDGRATVAVPEVAEHGEVTVTVQRGEIDATQTATAGQLEVAVTHDGGYVLPGQSTTVETRVESVPVTGATVSQDETVIGETDSDGAVTATLPFARTTAFTAEYAGVSTTHSVGGMARNSALLGGGVVVGLVMVGVGFRRFRTSNRGRAGGASRVNRVVSVAIGLGAWVSARLLALQAATTELRPRLIAVITAPHTAVIRLWRRRPQPIWGPFVTVIGALIALISGARGTDDTSVTQTAPPNAAEAAPTDQSMVSVQEAWVTFIQLVGRHVDGTHTPAEIARTATERGFPREPVEKLTESFREVAYGRGNPDQNADTAATALTDIETTAEANADSEQFSTEENS